MKITPRLVRYTLNCKRSQEEGFSLLEIAIVLAIVGLLGGMGLPLLKSSLTRSAIATTRAHQDYCVEALGTYVKKKGRFPAPADPSLKGPQRGLSVPGRTEGMIPCRTLGISETYIKDGFKRDMRYVVDPIVMRSVQTSSLLNRKGLIQILNAEGHPVLIENDGNIIAFVLISGGENAPIESGSHQAKQGVIFQEGSSTDTLIRWETLDQFLGHYAK